MGFGISQLRGDDQASQDAWFRRFLDWVGSRGVSGSSAADRRVRLTNMTAFLASLAVLPFAVYFALKGWWPAAVFQVVMSILYLHPILLDGSGRLGLGTISFVLTAWFHFTAASLVFLSPESGIHYYFFCFPPCCFLFFDPRQRNWILGVSLLSLVSFGVVEYARPIAPWFELPPASDLRLIHAGNTFGSMFFVSFIVYFFHQQLKVARAALREQFDRSETLLRNILPEEIALRLKNRFEVIADRFDAVTVVFADIVGFTTLSRGIPPADLVDILNEVFSRIDDLADRYGLEKIKTIGDAYMVAAGVPVPNDEHAQRAADFALDLRDVCSRIPSDLGRSLQLRIGLHSGPVVAGVIGKRKFSYDLWGDSVNTASRMESHGEPGRIQLSEETYLLLRDRYVCEQRGEIEVKGKGPMRTYFLNDRRRTPSLNDSSNDRASAA